MARKWISAFFVVSSFLFLSAAINVLEIGKVRSLSEPLDRCLEALRRGPASRVLGVGSVAPPLRAHDPSGKEVDIAVARPGKVTVLYLFSPACGWCRRNSPNMRALIAGAGKRFDFVLISLTSSGLRDYVSELDVRGTVYSDPAAASREAYSLGATPETFVMGPDGRIMRIWKGAYLGPVASEVAALLEVRLPGMTK